MAFRKIRISLPLLITIVLGAAGCHTARVDQPLTQNLGGSDFDSQLEFWHQLALRPVTSNDEAFHGLLLYLDSDDAGPDYAHRVERLKSRGILPPHFDRPADEGINRGTLAIAIAKVLKIRGGVMMTLTHGYVERYAVRELVYRRIFPESSPNQTFSGAEYVGVIGKIDDYQHGNPADVPASVMPGEMNGTDVPTTQEQK